MDTFNQLPGPVQIAILSLLGIPVTILIAIVITLTKMRLSAWIRQRQMRQLVKKYQPYGLNPLLVPISLHPAIPMATHWSNLSASERQNAQKALTSKEKSELSRLLRGQENLIRAWVRLTQAMGSEEARCFAVLLGVVEELGLIVTPLSNEVQLSSIEWAKPGFYAGKTIFYAPAQKSWWERLAGSILDLLLYLLLCPVYYFLLARAWMLLLPKIETPAGIAVVSIGCGLLSLGTVKLGRKLVNR